MTSGGTARQYNEKFVQALMSKGISHDTILNNYQSYFTCPECCAEFGTQPGQEVPNLLTCGHLCCNTCLGKKYCMGCDDVSVKKLQQRGLRDVFQSPEKEYSFKVVIDNINTPVKVSGDTTVAQLLHKNPSFNDMDKKGLNFMMSLNDKQFNYRENSGKQVKEIKQVHHKRTNRIVLLKRFDGGFYSE